MADAKTPPRLLVDGISVRFGGTVALDDVAITVNGGEVLALIGENGAGKSTLMKVLSGAVQPGSGRMLLDGQPYAPRNPQEARQAGVAMIYQELSLAPSLTVVENIFLGMEPCVAGGILKRKEMEQRARQALEQLGQQMPLNVPAGKLSISDQQLVEIARASAVGCKVLILDEPTSSITKQDVARLFNLIRTLKQQGQSIIYISHFIEEVKEICERFIILRDGKTVGGGMTAQTEAPEIVNMMVGRALANLYPRSPHKQGEAILEIENLQGAHNRLHHAGLTLYRGEVVGIFGLVGSGRTEFFRCLFGLDAVRNGKVRLQIAGADASHEGTHYSPAQRWEQKLGMVSEDRKGEGLALSRTIAENLILSNPQALERHGILRPSKVGACTREWICKLSIKCQGPDQKIDALSGGNQQKVAIARLLHHDVDVLLLDEPTRGIDVGSKKQIYELIDSLACAGKAVLMISSYLPELLGTCDRIAVMSRGRLFDPQPVEAVNEESIMLQATGADTQAIATSGGRP